MRKRVFVSFLISLAFASQSLAASWIDDWLDQTTGSAPSTFTGQQRGYVSGGSYSARWQTSKTFPISVSPPSIKAGCGGIDINMGGFSFIKDADLVVKKLESALSSAASIAFDMALNTLCEPCSTALRSFENIANTLNSLNFDSCATGKVMATAALSAFGSDTARESLSTEWKNWKTSSGVDNFYKADQSAKSSPGGSESETRQQACGTNADCTALLGEGSLLGKIASKRTISTDHIDLARGFIGDIEANNPNSDGQLVYTMISPCDKNMDGFIAIAKGEAEKRGTGGANCTAAATAGNDLRTKTADQINNIITAIKSKTGTIGSAERNLIQTMPDSLYLTIKHGVALGIVDANTPALVDYATEIMAFRMLEDLINEAYKGVLFYKQVASGTVKGATLQGISMEQLDKMDTTIRTMSRKNFEFIMAKTQQFQNYMVGVLEKDRIYKSMVQEAFNRKVI